MSLIRSCPIDKHVCGFTDGSMNEPRKSALLVGCCLTLFVRLRGFSDWVRLNLSPVYNIFPLHFPALSPLVFFSGFTISTLAAYLAHECKWRMGFSSAYPHPPPTVLPWAWGLLCIVVVYCVSICPVISLLLCKLHCLASKDQKQMGGFAVTQAQAERWRGFVLICVYNCRYVFKRSVKYLFVEGYLLN